jgi:DNA polymerase III subunit epsilon
MKHLGRRFAAIWAACFVLTAGSALALAYLLFKALPAEQQASAVQVLSATGELPYVLGLIVFGATGFLASWVVKAYFAPLKLAAEATALTATANPDYRLALEGPAELRALLKAVNTLADLHSAALREVDVRIDEARAALEAEKNRLAVLMSELAQSVIVCNPEGRILLYNEQARRLFSVREPSTGSGVAGFIGLGRPLYALIAREPVAHAIDRLHARTAAGEFDPVGVFTTTLPGGTLVRVRIAPMAGAGDAHTGSPPPAGFVLLLEDVGKDVAEAETRDRIVIDLIEHSRSALASLRAATENLAEFPGMDEARRARFTAIAVEEARRLSENVERASRDHADSSRRRPRALEPIRAVDLLGAVVAGLSAGGRPSARVDSADPHVWIDVDSHAIAQVIRYLVRRLHEEFGLRDLLLSATAENQHAYLDIGWLGVRLAAATTLAWEEEALSAWGEASSSTLREVLKQHGGEIWHEMERVSGRARLRIMLPVSAQELSTVSPTREGRPVFYDFDLFHAPAASNELDDLPLKALTYTVFDTETTGLEPSAGDEIISIGAVRIVNGRVLPGETYDQLVDPRRPIDPQSVKIHGIRDDMLTGQPTIERVLPAFHSFCVDTVLLGHNVAFDMRFLQIKEEPTGVRFRQPVLDTLLLSAVVHESIQDDRLEAIAHRLGIEVVARHTALGDAIVTAEVFLKMIPMLAERGIHTLREARAAAERTRYARIQY